MTTPPRPRLAVHGASRGADKRLKKPWRARCYLDGKNRHFGYFRTEEEARDAHAAAVKEHLGEGFLKNGEN